MERTQEQWSMKLTIEWPRAALHQCVVVCEVLLGCINEECNWIDALWRYANTHHCTKEVKVIYSIRLAFLVQLQFTQNFQCRHAWPVKRHVQCHVPMVLLPVDFAEYITLALEMVTRWISHGIVWGCRCWNGAVIFGWGVPLAICEWHGTLHGAFQHFALCLISLYVWFTKHERVDGRNQNALQESASRWCK